MTDHEIVDALIKSRKKYSEALRPTTSVAAAKANLDVVAAFVGEVNTLLDQRAPRGWKRRFKA